MEAVAMEVKTILAALCFSDYSPGTFNLAVRLAKCFDADIIAANVINIRGVEALSSVESMGYSIKPEDFVRSTKEERRAILDEYISQAGFPKERVQAVFRVGHPAEELLDIINENKVDLVVIGQKGRSDLPLIFIGSVAEAIHRHSPVTVVTYHPSKKAKP
jgi:universal stress protein A